jgi:hypothetical protein
MHVCRDAVRHVDVDHVRDQLEVEPSRRHVGGHHDLQSTRSHARQHALAARLREIAVQRLDVDALRGQALRDLSAEAPRPREDQGRTARPGYDWTPDGQRILIWAQGGIFSVDVAEGIATRIPFSARSSHVITEAVRFPQSVAPDSFDVKMLRYAMVSPDQRQVVYTALGKLWIRDLPSGAPRRLTSGGHFELSPSWSADGRQIAYATWDDD